MSVQRSTPISLLLLLALCACQDALVIPPDRTQTDAGLADGNSEDVSPQRDADPEADANPSTPDATVGADNSVPDAMPPVPDAMSPLGDLEAQLMFVTLDPTHASTDSTWGSALTDIVQHLPLSYGNTYYDPDFITYGHETIHGINSHIRNTLNTTGQRHQGLYLLNNKAVLIREPNMRKSAIAAYVPSNLRGVRYNLYVTGSSDWDDTPTYILDEWVAYVNGGAVGVDRVNNGLWNEGQRDGVNGQLEFTIYALALAMAVEANDPSYFQSYVQFKAFIAYEARRSMGIYKEGAVMPEFSWAEQSGYFQQFKTSSEAAGMRAFAKRVFGDAWASQVLEI